MPRDAVHADSTSDSRPLPAWLEVGVESRGNQALAFLISFVAHVSLMLVLACWVYTMGRPSDGVMLTANIGETETVDFDFSSSARIEPSEAADEVSDQSPSPELATSLDFEELLDAPLSQAGDSNGSGLSADLVSLGVDEAIERLGGDGSGRGAAFFGAYAEGNRFVYVVDSSRSMQGDRWVYACNQLIDSLNNLKPGQEFFVLCFDLETTLLFNTHPERIDFFKPSRETIGRVRRWLRGQTLGRATMPAEALAIALSLEPDAIFLLSDGELQDNSRLLLRRLNGSAARGKPIPIHTVHLFSRQGRQTLETIASENSGSFNPIDGS